MSNLFDEYEKRLNALEEEVRKLAKEYAEEFYKNNEISKEEAIEKGISKAEMGVRNL